MNLNLSLLEQWVRGLVSASWQAALLIVFVVVATFLLRRSRPTVRYALWGVVLIRLCLPFGLSSPLGVAGFSQTFERPKPIVLAVQKTAAGTRGDELSTPTRSAGTAAVPAASESFSAVPAARASAPLTAWGLCGIVWLIGAVSLGAFVLHRWSRLQRIVRQSAPCNRPELTALLDELCGRFGMKRTVALMRLPAGADTLGPCAAGWRRPRILLPARLAESWDIPALEPILIHELAHIRRADVIVNALQVLVQVIYWFHPLVWLANARLRKERELICDDFAVLHSGATSQRYGATILRAIEEIRPQPGWSLAGVGMGESGLAQRLRRLLDRAYALPRPVSRGAIVALLLAGMLGVLIASDAPPIRLAQAALPPGLVPPEPEPQEIPPGLLDFIRKRMADPDDPKALPVANAPRGEFLGQVVDPDGKPLAGVLVDAWDWCPGNETRTAADGTFRLAKLDPDERIEVRFIKEGFAPYTIIKQPLGELSAPVMLDNQTYFQGVVTGPDGKPVANAFIRANQGPEEADGVQIGTIWTETRSDAQGRYKLLVQDETYDLQVTSPGGLVARLPKLTIGPKEAIALDLPLEPGVVFIAHFVDSETNQPVAGVKLGHWEHPGVKGVSDAKGELRIAGLTPGPFEFEVGAKGYTRWWSQECTENDDRKRIGEDGWQRNFDGLHYDLSIGMKPVTITLEKGVRVRGKIVDPSGKPVAGATAAPARTGTGNSLTGDTRFSVKTREDGSFEVVLPASNSVDYNLIAHDGGYQEWRNWANGVSEPFRTKPGQEIEGLELRLNRPATVKGRVVDAAGKPVADREVRAHPTDLRDNRYYNPTFRTDKDGRYEIKFIRPGEHAVQVAPFWLQSDKAPPDTNWMVVIKEGESIEGPDLIAPAKE
jgi:beta-lactamase regulating signal transducer with metallopeptidase domain